MKKAYLIVNPHAGKMRSRSGMFTIIDTLCASGYEVTSQTTQYQGHAKELSASAVRNDYDLVVCCGGDGTLNETLDGIMSTGKNICVGYIPCGSTNDFATSLGISLNIKTAIGNIVKNDPVVLDLGRFNNRYFSYIASFGAFTSTSYSTSQEVKNALGYLAYVLQGVKDIAGMQKYSLKFTCDEYTESGEYIFGSVSNSTSVGGLVKLSSDLVDMTDGIFEVLLVRFPKDLVDLTKIVNGIIAKDFSSDMFTFVKTSKAVFDMEEAIPWTLDGEYEHGGTHVEIVNCPGKLILKK